MDRSFPLRLSSGDSSMEEPNIDNIIELASTKILTAMTDTTYTCETTADTPKRTRTPAIIVAFV